MSFEQIKKLRDTTFAGISSCKKALDEANGNFDEAIKILRKRGAAVAEKKKERSASQGLIVSYTHFGGNLGALVEVNCETDFVARTEVFKQLAKDLAMQVAAAAPKYIKREEIPEEDLAGAKDPEAYCKEACLMEQSFIKNTKLTMKSYIEEVIGKTGENISVGRFVRFALGS